MTPTKVSGSYAVVNSENVAIAVGIRAAGEQAALVRWIESIDKRDRPMLDYDEDGCPCARIDGFAYYARSERPE